LWLALLASGMTTGAQEWKRVWGDEFGGPRGGAVDAGKWVVETGGEGWGNNELEYYTLGADNAATDGEGHLVINAVREEPSPKYRCWYGPCRYTSARLKTRGKFEQAYGRFEARLKIPRGQGVWPAFWLLGADIDTAHWPHCGEIDIMENIGREPSLVHGTIHGPGYSGDKGLGASYALPGGAAFADDYHLYAVEWEPKEIRWYVDNRLYETKRPSDLPPGAKWVYDHPFFIILNLAIGGKWPGDPDSTTAFPQRMSVDYVRVYRRRALTLQDGRGAK
jgi:beta-glucanase (GH16 family)